MSALLSVLLTALILGLLAFLASLLLKTRQGPLGYVGAGYIGLGIGAWIFSLLSFDDPVTIRMRDPSVVVPVLATLLGSLIVLFLFSRLVRARR